MTVVRVPPVLRAEAGGVREVNAAGATVRELLEDLVAKLPALGSRVYDDGEIEPYVNVYVDGEDVRTRDGLETPVRESSTVILLPAMAGGCWMADSQLDVARLGACTRRIAPASPGAKANQP